MKNVIIASTSTLFNGGYLEYLKPTLTDFFKDVKELIFVPFARPSGISHDEYTAKVSAFFTELNISVKGLHEFENKLKRLKKQKLFLLVVEIRLFW